MKPVLENELDSGWWEWIPWRVRLALAHALGVLVAVAFLFYFRGARPSTQNVVFGVFFALVFGLFAASGARRSPGVVSSRLRRLFRESAKPEIVAIAEVLSETGEEPLFERHRRLVDRFLRGMITQDEFYAEMRALVG